MLTAKQLQAFFGLSLLAHLLCWLAVSPLATAARPVRPVKISIVHGHGVSASAPPRPAPSAVANTPRRWPRRMAPVPAKPEQAARVQAAALARPALPAASIAAPAAAAVDSATHELQPAGFGQAGADSYLAALRASIEEQKIYPLQARRQRQVGRVEVGFTIAKSGAITDVHVEKASSYTALNNAALAAVTAVQQFQPIPDGLQRSEWRLVVPLVLL